MVEISLGHKEVPVTHLRKMMLEDLQRRYYSEATTRYYIRKVETFARHFRRPPDRLGLQHMSGVSSSPLHETEVVTRFGDEPFMCAAVFLYPNAQKAVDRGGHALSEEGSSLAHDFEPRRR